MVAFRCLCTQNSCSETWALTTPPWTAKRASDKADQYSECYPEMLLVLLRRVGALWEKLLEMIASPQIYLMHQSIMADKRKTAGLSIDN